MSTAVTRANGNGHGSLSQLDAITRKLTAATTVHEAREVRELAELFRQAAKRSREGLKAQNACARVRILAERKAGALMKVLHRVPPKERHRGKGIPVGDRQVFTKELQAAGISHDQAYGWQRLAAFPEEELTAVLEAIDTAGEEITTTRVRAAVEAGHRSDTPPIEGPTALKADTVLTPLGLLPTDLKGLSETQIAVLLAEVRAAYLDLCDEAQPPSQRRGELGPAAICDWRFLRGMTQEVIADLRAGKIGHAAIRPRVRIAETFVKSQPRADSTNAKPTPTSSGRWRVIRVSPAEQFARAVARVLDGDGAWSLLGAPLRSRTLTAHERKRVRALCRQVLAALEDDSAPAPTATTEEEA